MRLLRSTSSSLQVLRNLPTERLDGLGGSDAEAESYVSALPLWSFNILSR
jgi:hypothetical protein